MINDFKVDITEQLSELTDSMSYTNNNQEKQVEIQKNNRTQILDLQSSKYKIKNFIQSLPRKLDQQKTEHQT